FPHRDGTDMPGRPNGSCLMRCSWTLLILALVGAPATAQEPLAAAAPSGTAVYPGELGCAPLVTMPDGGSSGGRLAGNQAFPGFIGFMSNPLQNIDPRAVTEIYPIFGSSWTSEAGPVPAADAQLYGAGLTIALSDRLAVG